MRVVTVIGNRPQFVKAAAVSVHLREEHDELLVHTGQHYDDELSGIFVRELDIPRPEVELGLGGGSNAAQTSAMLGALATVLEYHRPEAVLVYGDTNSTLAGGLAAAQSALPVAHVEAGMRSFDWSMPEELNRVLTDHLSSLLLCSSERAAEQLGQEAVRGHVEVVGDVMVDVALTVQPRARRRTEVLDRYQLASDRFLLATAHRPGNVDDPERLAMLVDVLTSAPDPLLLSLHPRTRDRLERQGLLARLSEAGSVTVTPPLGYLDFTTLLCHARAVLTDSGGVQKEAYLAGVRCLTLRDRTEWVETVATGWNTLIDLDRDALLDALERPAPAERPPLYGAGDAAARVVAALDRLAVGR